MTITYNEADVLWEVPIERSALKRIMDLAIKTSPGLKSDKICALRVVARTAERVLANVTKRVNARCGCPAIMAQVNVLNIAYEDAEIGGSQTWNDFDSFPVWFDKFVRLYIEGLRKGGTKIAKNAFGCDFEPSDAIRLIVTD